MRNELNSLQNIDLYIIGQLTGSELAAFEAKIAGDPAFAATVSQQQLFTQAVQRQALRNEIAAIAGLAGASSAAWSFWKILGLIGGSGLLVTAIIWISIALSGDAALNSEIFAEETSQSSVENKVPTTKNNSFVATPIIDSLLSEVESNDEESGTQSIPTEFKDEAAKWDGPVLISGPDDANKEEFLYADDTPCDGLDMMVDPHIQKHKVDVQKGKVIEGLDGVVVYVPKDAFLHENDEVVSGVVDFELVEAIELDDIILYNLTTESDNKLLETGGMVFVDAKQKGKQLKVNPDAPLYIEIPTDEVRSGMMAFKGEVNEAGNINWVEPKPLKKYLTKVDLEDLDFLPKGFASEVASTLPFKHLQKSTPELVDSLYYSLVATKSNTDEARNDIEEERPIASININPKKDVIRPRGDGGMVKGMVLNADSKAGIPYAYIKIYDQENFIGAIQTDENGGFWSNLPVSKLITFKVEAEGYLDQQTSGISTKSKPEYNLDIMMKVSPVSPSTVKRSKNTLSNTNLVTLAANYDGTNELECGINPMSIKTILTQKFENTFVATKEFEQRLGHLHKLENGQILLDLYLSNLDKDLWETDELIAKKTRGNTQKVFKAFAEEKLTNLKDASVYQKQLSAYYSKQKSAYQKDQQKLKKTYDKMNESRLNSLVGEYDDLAESIKASLSRTDQLVAERNTETGGSSLSANELNEMANIEAQVKKSLKAARRNPSRTKKYSTPWFSLGWMNIDNYLHLLEKGTPVDVKVLAKVDHPKLKVFQWLNAIKTVARINLKNGEGIAKFPGAGTEGSTLMKNTICFAIAEDDGKYFYADQTFRPYAESKVSVGLEEVEESIIRQRLQAYDKNAGKLLDHVNELAKFAKEAREEQRKQAAFAEQQAAILAETIEEIDKNINAEQVARAGMNEKKNELTDEIYEEQARLKKEMLFEQNLRKVAFPCYSDLPQDEVKPQKSGTVDMSVVMDIPSGFTPNGDGSNDVWTPKLMNFKEGTIQIKNSKGVVVMNGTYPFFSWSGNNLKDKLSPTGEYDFVIDGKGMNDMDFHFEGKVQLLKVEKERRSSIGASPPVALGKRVTNITYHGAEITDDVIKDLEKVMVYPEGGLGKDELGQVLLSFEVNRNGKPIKVQIKKSPNETLSQAVLEAVGKLPEGLFDSSNDSAKKKTLSVLFTVTYK